MAVSVGKSSIVSSNLVLYLDASSSSNYSLTEVEVLVVAGGGGGGGRHAGGGGGGGVIYVNSHPVTPGTSINTTVGNGGAAAPYGGRGGNGQNSVFGSLTAIGGGGGGGYADGAATVIGASGGSGGGGAGAGGLAGGNGSGGAGTPGQGNRGGDPWTSGWPGGGGGGAGAPGQSPRNGLFGGRGGDGLLYNISGTPRYYAGGGGGSGEGNVDLNGALGGLGGGGRSTGAFNPVQGQPGQSNTGGGGGGSRDQAGTLGGSGIVIVRYPGPQKATGGTITQVGGFTIHTFTSSGTFTPLTEAQLKSTFYGLQDLSTYTNSAVKVGTVTYNSANDGSLVFDGTNGTLDCGNAESLNFGEGDFTISIWFTRTTSAITNLRLLSKAGANDTANAAAAGFSFFGADGGISFAVNPTAPRTIIGAASYSLGEWVNVVGLVERGVSMRTYKNGSLTASTSAPSGSVSGTTKLFIGSNTGSNLFWTGRIGHVSIYNRALTATEITQNFNAQRGRFGI
jgi:hypothetical protein